MSEPPVVALQIQQKKGHGEFARMHLRRLALPPPGLVLLGHTEQQHRDNLLEAAGAALRTGPWKPGLCPGAPGQPAPSASAAQRTRWVTNPSPQNKLTSAPSPSFLANAASSKCQFYLNKTLMTRNFFHILDRKKECVSGGEICCQSWQK